MKRHVYLNLMPLERAVETVIARLDRTLLVAREKIPAEKAAGRIMASGARAATSSPPCHCAAMDGIAVKASSTFQAREGRSLRLAAQSDFAWVNTGNPLPPGFDAVIMVEHVVVAEDGSVDIEAPAFPWQHVRKLGEDIVAGELVVASGRLVSPYDVGALLSCGAFEVEVFERLRVAVIPTGSEVLDFTRRQSPGPGQVVESNSMMLVSLCEALGFDAVRFPPVPDEPENLSRALREALDNGAHAVVFVAGSSAGSRDFTRSVFEKAGEVLVHGLAAQPGKPALAALVDGKPVFGAPGYPVSAAVAFEEFFAPVLRFVARLPEPARPEVEAVLAKRVPSKTGQEEFVRLVMGEVGEQVVALPLARAAGMISTLTKAQGVTRLPAESEGADAGERVRARLLVPREELSRCLLLCGSHDLSLDGLAALLSEHQPAYRLAVSHVGSLGGLLALRDGGCLAAPCHLFDEDTSDFNFSFLSRYLPDQDVVLVNVAIRHQGLLVAPGNPKNISGVESLARDDVRFINRQRGAGTRILLDYHLKRAGIAPDQVRGYEQEEFTHMAVAVNVATGSVDCGLGIMSAAKALGLDFVPLARERYDLAILRRDMDDPRVQALLAAVRSPIFAEHLVDLGGYESQWSGLVMEPGKYLL